MVDYRWLLAAEQLKWYVDFVAGLPDEELEGRVQEV